MHHPYTPPLSPSFPVYFVTSLILETETCVVMNFMLFWNLGKHCRPRFSKYCAAAWIWWSVLCPFPVLTICKYFDGICQSPSLYFRTSPVCGGHNSKQVAWPSLYIISIQVGKRTLHTNFATLRWDTKELANTGFDFGSILHTAAMFWEDFA